MSNHYKKFDDLVVCTTLQKKYILQECPSGLGHNGSIRLYKFVKRQYFLERAEKGNSHSVKHCLQGQFMNM